MRAARIRTQLFEHVTYLHAADTERGARYRMANDLAARFTHRLERLQRKTSRLQSAIKLPMS